jgi:hypothetical protein
VKGMFTLKTPHDLLAKLERDYVTLATQPSNSDCAFNFFVTAEHLPEWAYPSDRVRHRSLRKAPLLALVSHVANGAKHFVVADPRHTSVADHGRRNSWSGGRWSSGPWFASQWAGRPGLTLTLDGEAAREFGQHVFVVDVASEVLAWWRREIAGLSTSSIGGSA